MRYTGWDRVLRQQLEFGRVVLVRRKGTEFVRFMLLRYGKFQNVSYIFSEAMGFAYINDQKMERPRRMGWNDLKKGKFIESAWAEKPARAKGERAMLDCVYAAGLTVEDVRERLRTAGLGKMKVHALTISDYYWENDVYQTGVTTVELYRTVYPHLDGRANRQWQKNVMRYGPYGL